MCLDRLAASHILNLFKLKRKDREGYKVFEISKNGQLYGEVFGDGKRRPVGKWLHEKDFRDEEDKSETVIHHAEHSSYPMGWHIFETKQAAIEWEDRSFSLMGCVIRKVRYRKVCAVGYQRGRVIIAKEMYIIPIKELKNAKQSRS